MRRPERRNRQERLTGREQARDGMDARDLERLVLGERRQDPRQPAGEHRLARAGRSGEEKVVPPGRGDLERSPRAFLAPDVAEIGRRGRVAVRRRRLVRRRIALAAQIRDGLGEVPDRDGLDPGEGGLGRRLRRTQDPRQPRATGALGDGEDSADGTDAAVEGELADDRVRRERVEWELSGCRQDREGDREIEGGSLLPEARRRQVHDDPPAGPLEFSGRDPAADALLRLLAGAAGEPDDRERRHAALEVRFDLDAPRLEAHERMRHGAGKHPPTVASRDARDSRVSVPIRKLFYERGSPRRRRPVTFLNASAVAGPGLPSTWT